jgi:hypothetical protein
MNIRVLFAIAVVSMFAAEVQARSPFGRARDVGRYVQRAVLPNRASQRPATKRISRNPVEMTRRFGPSILIREELADSAASKFVTQPI